MDIELKIKEILKDEIGLDSLPSNEDNFYDLGPDSLEVAEILMRVEDEFGIKLPEIDMTALGTVQDVIDKVREHC